MEVNENKLNSSTHTHPELGMLLRCQLCKYMSMCMHGPSRVCTYACVCVCTDVSLHPCVYTCRYVSVCVMCPVHVCMSVYVTACPPCVHAPPCHKEQQSAEVSLERQP